MSSLARLNSHSLSARKSFRSRIVFNTLNILFNLSLDRSYRFAASGRARDTNRRSIIAMDPLLAWIISCEASGDMDKLYSITRQPPRGDFERCLFGYDGHSAQSEVLALMAPRPNAPPSATHAKRREATSKQRDRSVTQRAQRDRAFDIQHPAREYTRAAEARRYRSLWVSDRSAWLEASKSRWRSLRRARMYISEANKT